MEWIQNYKNYGEERIQREQYEWEDLLWEVQGKELEYQKWEQEYKEKDKKLREEAQKTAEKYQILKELRRKNQFLTHVVQEQKQRKQEPKKGA